MPARPFNKNLGFTKDDAAKYYEKLYGIDHVHVLGRVLEKSNNQNLYELHLKNMTFQDL
jgi:hypothetical protein